MNTQSSDFSSSCPATYPGNIDPTSQQRQSSKFPPPFQGTQLPTRTFAVLVAALSLAVASCSGDSNNTTTATASGTTPAAPVLSGSQTFAFARGVDGTLKLTNSGGVPTSCTIGEGQTLPTGLTLSVVDNTCQISGTASAENPATSFTITATNAGGDASHTFQITVAATTIPAAPALSGSQTFAFARGVDGTLKLTNSGGAPTSCTIGAGQTLPTGLTLSVVENTCQISGTASAEASATSFTVTAANAGGSVTHTVQITVAANTNPAAPNSDTLVWSDEFDGTGLNNQNWDIQMGDGCPALCGWGNFELQSYTNKADNLRVRDGHLEITATRLGAEQYESARIRTAGKQTFRYPDGGTVRIEARMTLPGGDGLWPAFWMLPEDFVYGGWPQSGEIDIMEAINLGTGNPPRTTTSWATHYGLPWPLQKHATHERVNPVSPQTAFHTFAIEWEEGEIRWYIDDNHVHTQVSSHWYTAGVRNGAFQILQNGEPFDQDFHILLNVAVGGRFPGRAPSAQTALPQSMRVDWVRVFNCGNDESTSRCHKTTLQPNDFETTGSTGGSTAKIFAVEAFSDGLQTSSGITFAATASASGATVDAAATDGDDQVARLTFTAANGSVAFAPTQADSAVDISGANHFGHLEFDLKVDQVAAGSGLSMRIVDATGDSFFKDYSASELTRIMDLTDSSERQILTLRELKSTGSFNFAAIAELLAVHATGTFSSGQTVIELDDIRVHVPCPLPPPENVACGAGAAAPGAASGAHSSVTLDVTSDTTTYPNTMSLYSDGITQGSPFSELTVFSGDNDVRTITEVEVAGRGKVIQCSALDERTACGLVVTNSARTDLSAFSPTGFIEFDIRILTPPTDKAAEMRFKYEAEGDLFVDVSLGRASTFTTNNEWRRVRVDLNDSVWTDFGGNPYNLGATEKILWLPEWMRGIATVWQIDNVTLYRP